VAAFVAAGGTALVEPNDSPFGRMATIADPWGARFSVISIATQNESPV